MTMYCWEIIVAGPLWNIIDAINVFVNIKDSAFVYFVYFRGTFVMDKFACSLELRDVEKMTVHSATHCGHPQMSVSLLQKQ